MGPFHDKFTWKKVYEGKAKVIFKGPKKGTLIQYFKDDATAFNAKKFDVLDGKGELNNLISELLMKTNLAGQEFVLVGPILTNSYKL